MVALADWKHTLLDAPLSTYMTRHLAVVHVQTPVDQIAALLDARRISGVPVVDTSGKLTGVVTRTDLVALGALQAGRRAGSPAMPLPHRRAHDVMTREPQTVELGASLREAARVMATHAIHRVFVLDRDVLVGVIGAVDIALAVHDAKIGSELSTIMTAPVVTVAPRAPLGSAIDLLDRLRLSALVVVDEDRPIGLFTQAEALAARDLPRDTPIEMLYETELVCLPATTPLWVAAGHVSRLDVRRVVVCKRDEAIGLVSSLDFARWMAW
jgi:CBS domain-containing protein